MLAATPQSHGETRSSGPEIGTRAYAHHCCSEGTDCGRSATRIGAALLLASGWIFWLLLLCGGSMAAVERSGQDINGVAASLPPSIPSVFDQLNQPAPISE